MDDVLVVVVGDALFDLGVREGGWFVFVGMIVVRLVLEVDLVG